MGVELKHGEPGKKALGRPERAQGERVFAAEQERPLALS
jgi:hypothetical protein